VQGYALQDVDQVGVGVDAVQAAGDEEGLDDADVFGTELGSAKEPGFSAHRNDPQRALDMVSIDRNIGIGEKNFEARAGARAHSSVPEYTDYSG